MTDLRDKVVSGLRWQAGAKVGGQIVSWCITIIVLRLLEPTDYGLMAMTMFVVGIVALVADMGLGAALIRAREVPAEFQRRVLGLALLVNLGLYGLLLALAPVAARLFDQAGLPTLVAVTGLQLILSALHVVPESMACRAMQFKTVSLIELVTQIVGAVTTLSMALLGAGVWALVAGLLVAVSAKAVMFGWRFGWLAPTFALGGHRELLGFGGTLTVNRIVWYFASQADVFIAGRLLGPQLLGAYAIAANLASMPMQKLMAISNQVAFSAYAELQHDHGALSGGLHASFRLMLTLSIGLLWALAGSAPELVPLLLGSQWLASAAPLQVIALIVPLRIIAAMLSTALTATGHVGVDLRLTVCQALIMMPAFYVGATLHAVEGLAYAWAVAYPVFAAILLWQSKRVLRLDLRRLAFAVRAPVVGGLLMLAAMAAIETLLPAASMPTVLAAKCLAGGAAFVVTLYLVDRSLLTGALSLLGLARGAAVAKEARP